MNAADLSFITDYDIILASLVAIAVAALLLGIIYPAIDERARLQRRTAMITNRNAQTASRDKRAANELQ
jgi:hypothetical protein